MFNLTEKNDKNEIIGPEKLLLGINRYRLDVKWPWIPSFVGVTWFSGFFGLIVMAKYNTKIGRE